MLTRDKRHALEKRSEKATFIRIRHWPDCPESIDKFEMLNVSIMYNNKMKLNAFFEMTE